MKINNWKELQNIAINHSADIYYNNFVRIYRECTRKLYYFLIVDTTLPASDPLRFRKNLLSSCDNKNKANKAQYGLDRLATKISAYSSVDLRKYEYLADEDLGYKPRVFK